MLFSWLRNRRRRKLLADPFPAWWLPHIDRNVGHYPLLAAPEQARLRDITRILIAEKRWQGRGGLFVSEEMRVTIAAQAALLLLGDDRGYFPRVKGVFVFPGEFRTPVADDDWEDDELSERPLAGQAVDRGPVLLAWDEEFRTPVADDDWEDDELSERPLAGQAVDRGPVLLAWDAVLPEGRAPDAGHNVVLHEFAHQLDFTNGRAGGVPRLGDRALESRWRYVMAVTFEDHRRAIARKDRSAFFTAHAADDEMEFFADATEAFYCRPLDLKDLHPEVYHLLAAYYRVDPAAWFAGR